MGKSKDKDKDKDKDKGEQFVEGFKKIFSELETLYNGNGGLQDYSELVNRVTELEQELEEAKSKVAELEEAEKSKVAELEKAESRVAELEEEMKALREKGESDVARLEDEMKSLREEKEKEVHELEQKVAWQEERHDRLVMDFAEKYRDWDVDKQRHNDDLEKLAKLQGELDSATAAVSQAEAEKNELREGSEALASELEKHRTAATELKQRLGQKRLELRWTTYKLNECKLVVKQAKDQLGIIPLDTDRIQRDLEALAAGIHELIGQYFGDHMLNTFVTLSVSGTLAKIPQPASNSPEARAMRCAFAEAVVARELCRSIFTDLYPSDSATQSLCEGLARIFSWLDSSHPEEAVVTRCQLARAMAKSCDPKQCATRSAEKVCMTLGSWLGDKDRRRQFAADLGAQFEKAIDLWLPLQRADQHVRADTDLNSSEWLYSEDKRARYDAVTEEEETPKDSDIIPAPVHDHPVDFPLVVLFPRIFVGDDILFHGFSLFADQRAVIAAKVEQKKQLRSGSRASNRRNSNQDQLPCLSPKDLRAIAGSSGQGSKLRDLYLLAGSDLSVRKEPSQIDGKGTELSDGASVLSHRSESGANRG